jgi:hypothetical protein
MKKKARRIGRHSKGELVADEMNLVAALRQGFTESGCKNAAAAHGRIASDADL